MASTVSRTPFTTETIPSGTPASLKTFASSIALRLVVKTKPSEQWRIMRRLREEASERVTFGFRIETLYELWRATGDRKHLEEAHALLEFGRAHSPPEAAETILAKNPLHRAIMKAWAEGDDG